jgi:hypothetical protein
MRIIGLYGHANCGKSATLNMLKEMLRCAGKSISTVPHPNSDIPETFEYKGKIICVAPGGDTRAIVESNCRYFKLKNCDVAISATRTRWGSADALNEFAESEGVKVDWVPKSYEYNLSEVTKTQCNKETAEYLLRKL